MGAQLHGAVESLNFDRLGAILLIIIAVALDQWIKYWVETHMAMHERIEVVQVARELEIGLADVRHRGSARQPEEREVIDSAVEKLDAETQGLAAVLYGLSAEEFVYLRARPG